MPKINFIMEKFIELLKHRRSCWVKIRLRKDNEGNDANDNVKSLLGIPEQYSVLSMVALGHKERESKPFDESKLQLDKIHREKF